MSEIKYQFEKKGMVNQPFVFMFDEVRRLIADEGQGYRDLFKWFSFFPSFFFERNTHQLQWLCSSNSWWVPFPPTSWCGICCGWKILCKQCEIDHKVSLNSTCVCIVVSIIIQKVCKSINPRRKGRTIYWCQWDIATEILLLSYLQHCYYYAGPNARNINIPPTLICFFHNLKISKK